jgi:peptidoglycan/xylan/chitin deacetylase (PgdA/CDA1 family)
MTGQTQGQAGSASRPFPVLLGFDLDGETLWTSRDPSNAQRPVTLSQGRYGPEVAVPRILALLKRQGIAATFFVPGLIFARYPDLVRRIEDEGHEVGHHGHSHKWPDTMSQEEERRDFEMALEQFEGVLHHQPVGFRSPAWEFSPWTMGLLLEHGMRYSSNFMDRDRPYKHVVDGRKTDLVELPVQWLLDDAPFFLYSTRLPGRQITSHEVVHRIWKDEFDGLYAERDQGTCFVLAMHPQLIGRPHRLNMLDRFIEEIKEHDVRFYRCDEAADALGPDL